MSSSDTPASKHPLTSRAWNFFRIKDKNLKIAKCKLCQKLFSFRTSVTNLLKHVRNRHAREYHDQDVEKCENEMSGFSMSEDEDDDCKDLEINKAVKILESFERKNEEESICLLCQETFPDQSSAVMMEHMVKVHNISQIKLVGGNIHLEQEESKPVKNRSKRSRCWDYFTLKDRANKMALCNLCDAELSFKSTVSNLFKHLKRKHNITRTMCEDQYMNETEEKQIYKPRSAVWSFFNYVNDEKTICACVHCDKEFSIVRGLKDMKRHLLDKHPEALLHHKTIGDPLFITTNEGDDEGSEEEHLQAEYLDFDDLDMHDRVKRKHSVERRSSLEQRSSFERMASFDRMTSFDRKPSSERKPSFERRSKIRRTHRNPIVTQDTIPIETKTKIPDSLEHFSNYITSLLQELPEKISKQLQMSFVKQIIEAQISCAQIDDTKPEAVTKINSTVTRTVADSDTSTVEELAIVSEGTPLANAANSDGAAAIANGLVISPIVTTP